MADREATLILRLKDLASAGLEKVQSAYEGFRAKLLTVTAAMAALAAVAASSLKAYAEQEAATSKLNIALQNQGVYSRDTSKDLQAYAAQLQSVTTFSDEAILESEALLTTFGLTGDQLKRTTQAALDLSVGLGVDLKTATMLLGKAAGGETGTLARYGIAIDEGVPKAERLEAVLGQLNQRFGGAAQAQIETTSGKLLNFQNRVGELKERLGAELLPILDFWAKKLETVVGWVERLTGSTANDLAGRELTIAKLKEEMTALIEKSTVEGTYHEEATQRRLETFQDAIMKEQQLLEAETVNSQAKQDMARSRQQFLKTVADQEAEDQKKKNEKLAKDRQAHDALIQKLDEKIKADKAAFVDQQVAWEQKMTGITKRENELRAQNFDSTLSFISTLASAKNKALAAVGKSAAVAQATMDTYAAANRALASAPPPFNYGLAAAVVAAGLANVAKIGGVQLAEGGVVLPRVGGTMATIGEAGRAEAVIPLDDEDAQEKIAGAMGGGLTVNIHAGTIVADEMSVRVFAEKIDEELFRLSRNRRSVAF